MIGTITRLLGLATEVGGKLIESKEKKEEFAFKILELSQRAMEVMLATKTNPFVDGMVKTIYAIKDLIIPMFRPLGSIALAAFAAYCDTNNIALSETVQVLLYGAPVGWGVSRHVEKSRKPH